MDPSTLKRSFLDELARVRTLEDLEALRVQYIGRKSEFTHYLRSLKDLSIEERRAQGPALNRLRDEIEETLRGKAKELIMRQEAGTVLDVTMPGKKAAFGKLHPLTQLENEIKTIFANMNFAVVEGPEVETEFYNFDALNIPAHHPARDAWDTFWLSPETQNSKLKTQNGQESRIKDHRLLLRTHTSPMQARYMEKHQPPFQIIVPGRCFRYEATDASHEINFYQIEGLMVGKDISLANFKYVIQEFFKKFFHRPIEMRLRPSYFPFVEPGLEVDIKMGNQWLEVMGAGMVHQKVFTAVGYVPGQWQGFAFGMGLERLAMLKYKIPDIRLFYSGDLRFINQF